MKTDTILVKLRHMLAKKGIIVGCYTDYLIVQETGQWPEEPVIYVVPMQEEASFIQDCPALGTELTSKLKFIVAIDRDSDLAKESLLITRSVWRKLLVSLLTRKEKKQYIDNIYGNYHYISGDVVSISNKKILLEYVFCLEGKLFSNNKTENLVNYIYYNAM